MMFWVCVLVVRKFSIWVRLMVVFGFSDMIWLKLMWFCCV